MTTNESLIIADGVTLRTLNPHNMALKNDYMENLLVTAFIAFPKIVSALGPRQFKVVRGFESHAYIMQETQGTISNDLLRHAKGYALEFTWKSATADDLMLAAIAIYDNISEPIKIIVDMEYNTLYVGRGVPSSMIIEKTLNENRVIRKAA